MLDLKKVINAHIANQFLDIKKRYVVAVSGGVDSMTLLFCLKELGFKRLLVAHFDHGIREDSSVDRKLCETTCKNYGYQFVYEKAYLPVNSSEEYARTMRWRFLRTVANHTHTVGIITAHHLDDEIETALMFLIRGTGRKGMSSLRSTSDVIRPFLQVTKEDIVSYAKKHHLTWREDSTNNNVKIARNYLRLQAIPILKKYPEDFVRFIFLLKRQHKLNTAIDCMLSDFLHDQPDKDQLTRHLVIMMPHVVAIEFVAQWLRLKGIRSRSKKFLDYVVVFIKSSNVGAKMSLSSSIYLVSSKNVVEIKDKLTR